MKYKWKDKVRIKSKKELECISEVVDGMLQNGGAIMTIACLVEDADGYIMKEDGDFHFLWTDEMIEGLVEEESLTPPLKHPEDSALAMLFHKTLILPDGYIFKDENGNVINVTKIVLEKKEYPKTYEECCKVLGLNSEIIDSELFFYYPLKCGDYTTIRLPEMEKFEKFIQLYLCRNAYWKIYGEEMGLGKPWEPDWGSDDLKWVITCKTNAILKTSVYNYNCILAFPTAEMRDAFYENFKEIINECKELL